MLIPRWAIVLTLIAIISGAALVRVRLIDMPLERDEGEYAYAGQLMLQGIPPYKLTYNMKLPGTYAAYALIMAVFGQTTRGIHFGLIVVTSITILLVYLLGRRLFGQIAGLVASGTFGLLALSSSVLGLAAHATHFVTLFALAGTLLLLIAVENRRSLTLFGSGLFFGLAFLMKQPAIFFLLFAGVFLVWTEVRRGPSKWNSIHRIATFCGAAVLPFAVTCVLLAVVGVFQQFWFWTFSYANQYALNPSLWYGWSAFYGTFSRILKSSPALWLLMAVGLWMSIANSHTRRAAWFAIPFGLAAFATAVPGFYFREHYFIPLLPAVALFVGAGAQVIWGELTLERRHPIRFALPVCILLLTVAHTIYRQRILFFRLSPTDAGRAIYGVNPFTESVRIAQYIREHSPPDSRIAVIGSEPQIYFYSQRHSATGYIYTYALMESQKYALTMQQEMIAEIEAAAPEFVVFVNIPTSWLVRKDSQLRIFEWADSYARDNLQTAMLVDIESLQRTAYYSDERAISAIPKSKHFVRVLKRKDMP